MKTSNQFGSRSHMLETLKLAYQQVLDACGDRAKIHAGHGIDKSRHRLTDVQGKELGKRLAQYWLDKSLTERPKIGDKIFVPTNAARDIEEPFQAVVTSYKHCDEYSVEVQLSSGVYWFVNWTVCKAL